MPRFDDIRTPIGLVTDYAVPTGEVVANPGGINDHLRQHDQVRQWREQQQGAGLLPGAASRAILETIRSNTDETPLGVLAVHGPMTLGEAAGMAHRDPASVTEGFDALVDAGILERRGEGPTASYSLADLHR